MRRILAGLPTVLVLTVLAAIGWSGHRNGWVVPKFAELCGAVKPPDDWCSEHPVPKAQCVECNPDLLPRPKSFGWCNAHGIPECVLCHPELAQVENAAAAAIVANRCAVNALGFAMRPANSKPCQTHVRRIQIASAEAYQKLGIEPDEVRPGRVTEFVSASGTLSYDETRVAHLSVRSTGTVWRVLKRVGEPVTAGETLALVDAAEVGKAKAELLQASAQLALKEQTLAGLQTGASASEVRVREAEAAVRAERIRLNAARQSLVNLGLPLDPAELKATPEQLEERLRFLGLSASLIAGLDPQRITTNLLPLTAPLDGVLTSRDLVPGELVDPSRVVAEVVDLRHFWLTLDVAVEDANRLKLGQPVRFRPDGATDELAAPLAWISTQADPKTRTVKVRADLPNPAGQLRANSFGTGRVILRDDPKALLVPVSAVHWEGCCHVVFVRDRDFLRADAPKVFHTRKVRLGASVGEQVEIAAGLLPGEVVAAKNSGHLRAELLKSGLGEA